MKKDIAIAIAIGSPNSTIDLVRKTFDSIKCNIGHCDWMVFVCLGENINAELRLFVKNYVSTNHTNFCIFLEKEVYWAEFINEAIKISKDYKYFIKSHDDIELLTPNFFNIVDKYILGLNKKIGWVSFTDIGWRHGDFSPSTRPGYHLDILSNDGWKRRNIFQFHQFPSYWTAAPFYIDFAYRVINKLCKILGIKQPLYPKPVNSIKKYKIDMPVGPVKCHAPFNHFVLIQRESLDLIGSCENWQTYNALLVDEDWGLRALELNLPNIWMPQIEYFHFRGYTKGGGTRSDETINLNRERVHQLFYKKWGFSLMPSAKEIQEIRKKHYNNLIPWSSYRNSFDWDYII